MDWSNIAPMVVVSVAFLTMGSVFVLRGPVGKALADRIARRSGTPQDAAEVDRLRVDVDELRAELGAVQERLDFAERLLSRGAERGALRPGA